MLLLFSLLVGCSDHMVSKVIRRKPEIIVSPSHINFGHLISGQERENRTFSIINAGDDDLRISSPVLVSGNDRYELQEVEDEYIIKAGELVELSVEYEPKSFEANGAYIEILSNDDNEPSSLITLEGYGDAPSIQVTPTIFDYGTITIGCDNEERVTIKNVGNMPLTVHEISQMVTLPVDIIMELGSLPESPWVLEPEHEIDFLISYIPTDVGSDSSEVIIFSDDPLNPEVTTGQKGVGDVENWFSQIWVQEEISVLDILWVIDNSGSMNIFQTNLAANIGIFMNAFANTGADYRMAVITTDRSSFITVIDSNTPNAEAVLSALIMTGVHGSGMEKGIEMAYRSLDHDSAAPGGDFFRDYAKLAVVFVSDEPDHSFPWSTYINFFNTIKPLGDFIPYGVIGDVPGGCIMSSNRSADPGFGYWDLIDHFGGSWYSICASDWGVQLQDMAEEMTGRNSFILDEVDPIENTISVRVNGQVSSNWTYDALLNSVIFNQDHTPLEGQTITIEYAVWGCGE